MQKIHRRKNQQINKQFICPTACGKVYGSYAALYTHIKNKHPHVKPPEMKEGSIKIRETRPRKQKLEVQYESIEQDFPYDCKTCKQIHCICYQEINQEEMDRTIELFQDQAFIKFIDAVGQFSNGQKFAWTRGTEDQFQFLAKKQLREMAADFNEKYHTEHPVILTGKWLEYLSMSSRFWDPKYVHQLYSTIFAILCHSNQREVESFINNRPQFANTRKCMEIKPKQWSDFVTLVRIV